MRLIFISIMVLSFSILGQSEVRGDNSHSGLVIVIADPFGSDSPELTLEQITNECVFLYAAPKAASDLGCAVEHLDIIQSTDFQSAGTFVAMQVQAWGTPSDRKRRFVFLTSNEAATKYKAVPVEYPEGQSQYELVGFQTGMLGTFLVVRGESGTSGQDITYSVYRQDQNKWVSLESDYWHLRQLGEFLPHGFFAGAPESVDFGSGSAIFPVYDPKDPLCCPSGGKAVVQLAVHGNKFVISDLFWARHIH